MNATSGVALILVLLIPKFVIAQDDEQAETNAVEENTRPIEQIDVTGERTLLSMRYQIRVAEETLYNLFNDLNTVEKYNVRCKTERRTGTFIPIRSCEPKFFLELRRDISRDAIMELRGAFDQEQINFAQINNFIDRLQPESEIRAQLEGDYEGMQQEMFRLAMENEDYREQLLRIGALKAEYEAAWEERFGNRDD